MLVLPLLPLMSLAIGDDAAPRLSSPSQQNVISGPSGLSKRAHRASSQGISTPLTSSGSHISRQSSSRHRPTPSQPSNALSLSLQPSRCLALTPEITSSTLEPPTPTPTGPRTKLVHGSSHSASESSGHLPLSQSALTMPLQAKGQVRRIRNTENLSERLRPYW